MTNVVSAVPIAPVSPGAQNVVTPEPLSPSDAAQLADVGGPHFNQEIQFTFMIMMFALVSLLFLYLAAKSGKATPFFLRIYLITIIVFGTLAIVASAYTTEQIAPVVGLFGTIAGYVLGKSERPNDQGETQNASADGARASGGAVSGGGSS